MAETEFTENFNDCESCNETWRTEFVPSRAAR